MCLFLRGNVFFVHKRLVVQFRAQLEAKVGTNVHV